LRMPPTRTGAFSDPSLSSDGFVPYRRRLPHQHLGS
jgi:hypothetical protein